MGPTLPMPESIANYNRSHSRNPYASQADQNGINTAQGGLKTVQMASRLHKKPSIPPKKPPTFTPGGPDKTKPLLVGPIGRQRKHQY
eukprot:5398483-Pyramimonas_sp.AAC.1